MVSKTDKKIITLFEAKNTDLMRKLNQIERAQKKAFNDNQIKKFNGTMGKSSSVAGKISTRFSQAGRSVAILEGPLGGVAGRFSAIASSLGTVNPALIAAGVSVGALTIVATKSVKAFEKYEAQQLKLQSVLKATDYSAGRTSSQLEALAQNVGADTLANTSGVRDAIAQLLTFRSISGQTFDRTIKLSQDLAAVGFGTLSSSAVQLGKALEDPVTGLSALRRVGVSFSQSQKEIIKNFVATGDVAKAQNAILDAVEKQVGGAGVAAGSGLAGAYDGLAEATGILLERWGEQIVTATGLTEAIRGIAGAVDAVNKKATLPGQLEQIESRIKLTREILENEKKIAGTRPPGSNVVGQEETRLKDLMAMRKEIVKKIDQESVEAYSAYSKSIKAQEIAANERIESVIASQKKILENAKKTPLQRVVDANLTSAGVKADSDDGKRIVDITKRAFAMQTVSNARNKVADAAQKQSDKVKEVIKALELEREQMGMSEVQRRVQNELIKAGSSATQEQKDQIEQLVIANDNWAKSNEMATDLASFAGQQIQDQFSMITSEIETGNDALDRFVQSMLDAALQASLFGNGPLGSLFGGGAGVGASGGGGLVASLASLATSFLGFDGGGWTGPGSKYMPKGIVHADEYVFSKEATKRLGVANLDALHRSAKGFAQGGFVGGPVPMIPKPVASTPAANRNTPTQVHLVVEGSSEFDLKMKSISGEVAVQIVDGATPGIIKAASKSSRGNLINDLNSYEQNSGGSWRG